MNTDTHSYRDKGRALFLAAIMVSSMVAGVAVFGVAPAAATNSDVDQNADNFGSVVGFETQDGNVGPFGSGTNLIEIAYEGDITSDIGTRVNVTLLDGAGDEVENSSNDLSSANIFSSVSDVEDEFTELDSFSSASVNITPNNDNTNILLEIDADNGGYGTNPLQDNNVSTIQLTSNDGGNDLNTTDLDVTYATQTIVGFQNDETVVSGGQIAVQTHNDSSNNLSVRSSSGDGLIKTVRAVNDEFNGGFVEQGLTTGSDIAVIDTGTDAFDDITEFELQPSPQGDITVDDGNVSNISVDSLGLEVTDVDTSEVEVNDDDQIVTGDEVEVTVETLLTSRNVDVEAQFNGVSLGGGAEATVNTGTDGETTVTLDLTSASAGNSPVLDTEFDGSEPAIGDNLTVEATEQEVGATAEGDTIQLVEQEETEAAATIESGVVNENVGDFAFFDIAVEDAGTATFNITEGEFDAGAEIDFDSATGGEVTLGVNTAALDSPSTSTGDFFITGDTDDEVTAVSVSNSPSGNVPAVTYRAQLSAGDATDRTQLNLIDQEFNSLSTHVAPTDADTPEDGVDAFLTEVQTPSSIVATSGEGEDQLALLGDAGGFYGLNGTDSSSVADDLQDEFEIDSNNISADGTVDSVGGAGHGFVFVEAGTGVSDPATSSLSDVVADNAGVTLGDFDDDAEFSQGFGEGNQFLVSLNASALSDELNLDDGDSVEIRHVVDVTQYPYLDASNFDDDVITTFDESVTIEDAQIDFDDVNGDSVYQVAGQDNVTISGDTNLAPGTEITVTVSGDADFESQTVEVTENPGFEAVFDLSGFDTEQELDNIEAEAPAIGGNVANEIESEFADVPEQDIETADQEQIAELEETIANLEEQISNLEDERDTIAEERDAIAEERDSLQDQLEQADSEISDLQGQNEDLQAQLEDAESTISDLQSQNEDLNSTVSDLESQVADLEGQLEEAQNESGDSDGGGPGFGVAAALVALIGAALLAVRRRD